MVPQATLATLPDGSEIKLGKWVQRQRQLYKNTCVRVSEGRWVVVGRVRRVVSIAPLRARNKRMNLKFLVSPPPVPPTAMLVNPPSFVTPHARKAFGQMSEEQKDKLDSLGFEFDVPEELRGPPPVNWDAAFEALKAYHKRHGDTKVPEKTLFGDLNQDLGKWCQRQRQVYKNTFVTPGARKSFGKLTEEQKAKLDSLDFDFPA